MKILSHDLAGHAFIAQLSRGLAARGHEVCHVYSASSQYPNGVLKVRPGDAPTLSFEGIVLSKSVNKYAFVRRYLQDREHAALVIETAKRFRPDVILCSVAPSVVQDALSRYARRVGIRYVSWVQDLYGLAAYKILKRKLPILGSIVGRHLMALEKHAIRRSDAVVPITESFRPVFTAWGIRKELVEVIPNWGPVSEIEVLSKNNAWSRAHDLHDKRCVIYAGTLAMKHDPSLLLALARKFQSIPDIRVIVASEGRGAEWLATEASHCGLLNLLVIPFQQFADLSGMLATAEILVAFLQAEASTFSVPSKILSYLCAGRPILLSVPGDNQAADTIARSSSGVVTPANDVGAFVSAAEQMLADDQGRELMGRNARRYAEASFNIVPLAERFEKILQISGHDSRKQSFAHKSA